MTSFPYKHKKNSFKYFVKNEKIKPKNMALMK